MSIHIESLKKDIAKIVIMPGDPLRAKMIAEEYLENYKIVNTIRNMIAYTGYYKGKLVTVFPSGMGIPSIGIYAYELYKFYDVETIIRIGTCGTFSKKVKMLDIVIAEQAYSTSTYAYMFNNTTSHEMSSTKEINDILENNAKKLNINCHRGKVITSDVFDLYVDHDDFIKKYPHDEFLASEMEAFCLFFLAKFLNKKAACLLTVVDSYYDKVSISSEKRQKSLKTMIELALESI